MKQTVGNLKVKDKIVIVRVDFNVPLNKGIVGDDNRIVEALPTIKHLLKNGAKVVLLSHLGKVSHKEVAQTELDKATNDMKLVAPKVGQHIGPNFRYINATRGSEVEQAIKNLKSGEVLLLQNTRYEKGEEKNDPELAAYWANLGHTFVMDAFGSAHRAHASTHGIPELMKKQGKQTAIGLLVEKEVKALSRTMNQVEHPYIAILGGAKVSDKIKVIDGLLTKADKLIISGAMAYTFLKAMGVEVGTSRVEEPQLDYARSVIQRYKNKIILPIDFTVTDSFDNPVKIMKTDGPAIPKTMMGLDIGPKSIEHFKKAIQGAKVIFWNGPVGVFEKPAFAEGTKAVCKMITEVAGAFTVIGGGDSAAAAAQFGYKDKFSHVSTGGGASLEMIENNGKLPGIDIIADQ
jgi:phosphoglycerate kinase